MKATVFFRNWPALLAIGLTQMPMNAAACTACMGDANSKIAPAINAAIFLMLGFIGAMLACAAALGIHLMRRANSPLPPHTEFDGVMEAPEQQT